MSVVQPQTSFLASESHTISGGLGIFDSQLALLIPTPPIYWTYAFGLLQNSALVVQVNAASDLCQDSDDCRSYLLTSGLESLSPSPYGPTLDSGLTAYVVQNAPAYQLEIWSFSSSENHSSLWSGMECKVFGRNADGQKPYYVFQLCHVEDDANRRILAGYRVCIGERVDATSGECIPDGWTEEGVPVSFIALSAFKCRATTAADRRTNALLDVSSITSLQQHRLSKDDIFTIFSTILCPFGSASSYCGKSGLNSVLTDAIRNLLRQSLPTSTNQQPNNVLANLIATGILLFNPVYMAGLVVPPSIADPLLNLPEENYFPGVFARQMTYTVPDPWTVKAYIGSAALMLCIAVVGFLISVFFDMPENSTFPAANIARLQLRETQTGGQGVDNVRDLDELLGRAYSDREIIRLAEGARLEFPKERSSGVAATV